MVCIFTISFDMDESNVKKSIPDICNLYRHISYILIIQNYQNSLIIYNNLKLTSEKTTHIWPERNWTWLFRDLSGNYSAQWHELNPP